MGCISLKTQNFKGGTEVEIKYSKYLAATLQTQNFSEITPISWAVCTGRMSVSPGWRTDQWIQWFHKKEQTFCGLKGLVLEDTPVSRGSCKAFCMQNCWRSAAAWETWWQKGNQSVNQDMGLSRQVKGALHRLYRVLNQQKQLYNVYCSSQGSFSKFGYWIALWNCRIQTFSKCDRY